MNIQLIPQNARIPLNEIGKQIRQQWIESGAITEQQNVVTGLSMERGVWYINLVVEDLPQAPSKIIKPPNRDGGLILPTE